MRESLQKRYLPSKAGINPTEQELAELVRRKDPAGMRCFYERFVGYLTAVCSRYVADRSIVKDVLQEAFINMLSHIDRFEYRGEGSLKAWATRIVVNQSLKTLRNAGRLTLMEDLPEVSWEEEDLASLPDIPPEVLQEMICSLPDGYRTVFNLYVLEKKTHREIAGLLGIKEDSSASQLSRARAYLARRIKEYLKKQDNE